MKFNLLKEIQIKMWFYGTNKNQNKLVLKTNNWTKKQIDPELKNKALTFWNNTNKIAIYLILF